ncbi:MAG: GNAT family N-acetyltransferase [Massilia sp.]
MHIRPLLPADLDAVAALLHSLASEFILHETPPEQAAVFLQDNSAPGIRAHLANGFAYHVAEDAGAIVGFIGMRERRHLFHLFVDKRWQGRGLSRALWDAGRHAAIDAGGAPPFTVNASNYALPAYQRLGFVATAPMTIKNGIRFTPMQWG